MRRHGRRAGPRRAGSAGSCRPSASGRTGRATAAHLAGGAGRPTGSTTGDRTGGILTDIASHQIDQFLWFTGSDDGRGGVQHGRQLHPSRVAADAGLRRGDCCAVDSAHGYVRVDWYTPQGLPTWGDGRLVILGTEGYLELRKYVDIAGRPGSDHLFVVDGTGTEYVDCSDVELSYYPDLVHDVATAPRPPARRSTPSRSCGWRYGPAEGDAGRGFAPMNGPADQERLRVGIVGCGGSPERMPGLRDNARVDLVGVVTSSRTGREFAERFATTPYGSVAELARSAARPGLGHHSARHPRRDRRPDARSAGARCCWRSRRP